jgi:pimeloyl-ACP methyl ester carboxylesterase
LLIDAGFRAIVSDQRGYGQSDKPHDVSAYRMASLGADITTILDALGIDKAHVIGHDRGLRSDGSWRARAASRRSARRPGNRASRIVRRGPST